MAHDTSIPPSAHPLPALHPDHLADLRKSGITPETAEKAGLYSVDADGLKTLLGWSPKGVKTGMVIPYLREPDHFFRVKLFPPYVDDDGKENKYLQRKDTGVRLYVPPDVEPILGRTDVPLRWVEGEKKSLAAMQDGIQAVGIGGIHNFARDDDPLDPQFYRGIAFAERTHELVPDSDAWARPDLLLAVSRLGMECETRGGVVQVVMLQPTETGAKQGYDDLPVEGRADAFAGLKRIGLKHQTFATFRPKKLARQDNGQPNAPEALGADKEWIRGLSRELISCQHNALAWLEVRGYADKVALDTFKQVIWVNGESLTDEVSIEMVRRLEGSTKIRWVQTHVHNALINLGTRRSYSSLKQWLEGLRWDGKKRIELFFTQMYGAEVSDYTSACAKVMFLSAVARAYEPGCKADIMIVLIGKQGLGKSRGIEDLVPEQSWYTDDLGDLYERKAGEGLQGKWIIEFGEFARINRATIETVKSFISRRVDHYRPAYGRVAKDFSRQCIFVGTTNNPLPLQDLENRRFMPVWCRQDVGDIASVREQLWAEAVHRYKAGEKWWLQDKALLEEAKEHQEAARQHDEWEEILKRDLLGTVRITLEEAANKIGLKTDRLDKSTQIRLGLAMSAIGFVRKREPTGRRERYYEREPK
jgi:hypothetical protein